MKIKLYRKKQLQPMFPWSEYLDMTGISISAEDIKNGSPKSGDMIAINPNNQADRWLVAATFFADNYEEATDK